MKTTRIFRFLAFPPPLMPRMAKKVCAAPQGQGTVGMPASDILPAGRPLSGASPKVAEDRGNGRPARLETDNRIGAMCLTRARRPCPLARSAKLQLSESLPPRSFPPEGPRLCASRNFLRSARAYSLIEVLIAGAILVIGISGAAMMANTLLVQEESSGFSLRAFNAQEQAARLWQLGLSPTDVTNILPERCTTSNAVYSIQLGFSNSTTNITNVGSVEILSPLRLIYHSGYNASNTPLYRTNDIVVVRPTIL